MPERHRSRSKARRELAKPDLGQVGFSATRRFCGVYDRGPVEGHAILPPVDARTVAPVRRPGEIQRQRYLLAGLAARSRSYSRRSVYRVAIFGTPDYGIWRP